MWIILAFPIIYDVAAATLHWVSVMTPRVVDHAAILAETEHRDYYLNTGYSQSRRESDWMDLWNSWLIWNTATLAITLVMFIFYGYYLVQIIIAVVDQAANNASFDIT